MPAVIPSQAGTAVFAAVFSGMRADIQLTRRPIKYAFGNSIPVFPGGGVPGLQWMLAPDR
ncbi:MAG: hypothetical protein DWH91_12745 [Planctomycetota bacterium]|nr:MAG: hypothetical protein DWH91_12745 [Planctomycetota bacterium]